MSESSQYTVKRFCGHSEVITIAGTSDERDRILGGAEWKRCETCVQENLPDAYAIMDRYLKRITSTKYPMVRPLQELARDLFFTDIDVTYEYKHVFLYTNWSYDNFFSYVAAQYSPKLVPLIEMIVVTRLGQHESDGWHTNWRDDLPDYIFDDAFFFEVDDDRFAFFDPPDQTIHYIWQTSEETDDSRWEHREQKLDDLPTLEQCLLLSEHPEILQAVNAYDPATSTLVWDPAVHPDTPDVTFSIYDYRLYVSEGGWWFQREGSHDTKSWTHPIAREQVARFFASIDWESQLREFFSEAEIERAVSLWQDHLYAESLRQRHDA